MWRSIWTVQLAKLLLRIYWLIILLFTELVYFLHLNRRCFFSLNLNLKFIILSSRISRNRRTQKSLAYMELKIAFITVNLVVFCLLAMIWHLF